MLQFHIAVCDDEPFAASSISGAAERELARQGAQADIEVFNGVEPLARRLDDVTFDLVLLDIEMSSVDGITFGPPCARAAPRPRSSLSPTARTASLSRCR